MINLNEHNLNIIQDNHGSALAETKIKYFTSFINSPENDTMSCVPDCPLI